MDLDLKAHRCVLLDDAETLSCLARFMRDLAARRPDGSAIADDLDRWAVMILGTAEAFRAGAERLLG